MTLAGLSFRDLEYAAALARHLHFSRAAQECSVSQPTLSAQIRKLEELLGVTLFERTGRGVLVTDRGRDVMAQVQVVLAEARRLRDVAQAGAAPLTGRFRLGVLATLAPYIAPSLLGLARERFPGLQLSLGEGPAAFLLRRLHDGELDAVVLPPPAPGGDVSELPLFREDLVLAVPRDHPLASSPRVALGDIPPGELIVLSAEHDLHDLVQVLVPPAGAAQEGRQEGRQEAASLEVLRQMVGAGLGCALMPQLSVQVGSLLDDMVAYRVIRSEPAPGRDMSLFYRSGFSRLRDTRLMRDLIRDAARALGTLTVAGAVAGTVAGAGQVHE